MAEKYKTTTVSKLPEPSTLDGFYAFGTDKNNNSVKVPIDMLKGNVTTPVIGANGNWWVNGIDTGQTAQSVPNNKTIFNVSQYNNVFNYTDQATARNAVPAALKGLGQQITYKLASGKWVNEQYTGTDVSGWTTVTNWKDIGNTADLEKRLYTGTSTVDPEEIIPINLNGSYTVAKAILYYKNQSVLAGKLITSIRLNVKTAGTLTVYRATGAGTSDYLVLETQTLTITGTGDRTVNLTTPMQINSGEMFGFYKNSDTASFYMNTSVQKNPVGGGFYLLSGSNWTNSDTGGDLGVGVIVGGYTTKGDIPNIQDRITVLETEENSGSNKMVDAAFNFSKDFATVAPNDATLFNIPGAIRYSVETLLRTYPNVKIVLVTSPYLGGATNAVSEPYNNKITKAHDYVVKSAEKLSVPVIDVTFNCGIYPLYEIGQHKYLSDYIHPNADGGALIGSLIGNNIRNILGKTNIDGSLCILGDSLSDTQYAKSGKWLSAFNAIITATEVRNYARSGASWSHTASTVYNITDGGGNWDAKNVIWNQVNRLINDVQNNGKAIPKVIIAFASTNDAMILM